jgi:hypothetical protein
MKKDLMALNFDPLFKKLQEQVLHQPGPDKRNQYSGE